MRRLLFHISCLGLILAMVAPASRALAADGISATAGGFAEFFVEDEDNAKFNEYRYKQDEEFGGQAYMDMFWGPSDGEGEHQVEGDFLWRSPEDFDAALEHVWYGVVRGNVEYLRMGHVFAYDVKSLHTGQGTGELTVEDAVQSELSTTPNDPNILIEAINRRVNEGNIIDLALRRDRLKGELEIFAVKPFTVRMGIDYEEREGTRPWFITFLHFDTFGGAAGLRKSAIEVAEPIDYTTTNAWAELEYQHKEFYGNIRFYHSTFNNEIDSLMVENPFVLTGNPKQGEMALPPDNYHNSLSFTGAHELPFHSRLTASAVFGWNRQNENLVPFTSNPVLAAAASDPFVPRSSADAKVDTELYHLQWVAHPIDRLHAKAGFRYYSHENRTIVQTFENRAPWDDFGLRAQATPAYVSYIMRTVEGELAYEVLERTTLTFIYELEGNSFENGSADKENIQVYEAAIDSWFFEWLRVQLSTTLTDKNSLYKDNLPALAEVPWQRKYYAATKDRFAAHAMGTIMVNDGLSFTIDYTYGQDDYDFSPVGLKETRDHAATISMDLALDSWMTFSAWYTFENYKSEQESLQWENDPICNPLTTPSAGVLDTLCNWTLESQDNVHTVGFTTQIIILPDKLTADADGVFTTVNSKADFESPVGIAGVNDLNAFVPVDFNQVDETKFTRVNARLTYAVNENFDIFGGYIWEDWQIEDFLNTPSIRPADFTHTAGSAPTYNHTLVMDTLYSDYTVNIAYVGGEYRFGKAE